MRRDRSWAQTLRELNHKRKKVGAGKGGGGAWSGRQLDSWKKVRTYPGSQERRFPPRTDTCLEIWLPEGY